MAERVYLTVAEVVAIHHHQIEEYGGAQAAALLESLVNNHAFLDGNKQVGFAAVHTFLLVNGSIWTLPARFQFVMKALEDGKFRFALLHEWISEHLMPLNG